MYNGLNLNSLFLHQVTVLSSTRSGNGRGGMGDNSTLPIHSWTDRLTESAILNTKLKLKLSNLPNLI